MPVDPARVDGIADTVAAVYDDAELALIRMITARLARGLDAADWQTKRLSEVGQLQAAVRLIVARLNTAGPDAVRAGLTQSWRAGLDAALTDLAGVGRVPQKAPQAVQALTDAVLGELRPLHSQILPQTVNVYRRAVAAATSRKLAGVQSTRRAAQAAWAALVDDGVTGYTDTSGRRWRLSSYVEMAVRTAVTRSIAQATIDACTASGNPFVYVTDRPQECSLCLVPGTLVEGPVPTWAARSEYRGDVVSVTTAAGHNLTGTPDHPVLTPQGWRPLKDLRPGDKVVSDRREHGIAGVVPDHVQVPTPIEQFAQSGIPVLAAGPARRNLDSDVSYREIHGVRAHGDLLPELHAALAQPLGDLPFVGGIGSAPGLFGGGGPLGDFGWPWTSAGLVGGGGPLGALLGGGVVPSRAQAVAGELGTLLVGEPGHVLDYAVMAGAGLHSGTFQVVGDGAATDPECFPQLAGSFAGAVAGDEFGRLLLGQGLGSDRPGPQDTSLTRDAQRAGIADVDGGARLMQVLAGHVQLDEVVDLSVRQHTGHVWDLQTGPNWFLANGIVTHNCRPWEHKVLSITAPAEGPAVATIAEARAAGLQHPQCRHDLAVWVPGVTRLAPGRPDPAGDVARQAQRGLERQIRHWRERQVAALDDTAALHAAGQVAHYESRIAAHVSEHGLTRKIHREHPGAGHVARPSRRHDTARL